MRKFISLILTLTLALTLIASMSVSANGYVFDFGTPSVSDTTATVPVLVDFGSSADEYLDSALFRFTTENCTITGATTTWEDDIEFTVGANIMFNGSDVKYGITGEALTNANKVLFTLNVSKTADNASISFISGDTFVADSILGIRLTASATNANTIELWKASAPEASAEIDSASDEKGTTIDAGNELTYINVPNYVGKVSVSNLGDKKVVVTPVIKVNGEAKTDLTSAPTITFDKNSSFDNGKVVFKFALIGAPEDLINAITIEATTALVD